GTAVAGRPGSQYRDNQFAVHREASPHVNGMIKRAGGSGPPQLHPPGHHPSAALALNSLLALDGLRGFSRGAGRSGPRPYPATPRDRTSGSAEPLSGHSPSPPLGQAVHQDRGPPPARKPPRTPRSRAAGHQVPARFTEQPHAVAKGPSPRLASHRPGTEPSAAGHKPRHGVWSPRVTGRLAPTAR